METSAYRALLDSRRIALLEELGQAEQSATRVPLDQTAQGRLTRMDAMQQQAMAANHAQRLRLELRKLDAALDRVAAGSYGTCCGCGEPMTRERLLADPAAPFCHDCADGHSPGEAA